MNGRELKNYQSSKSSYQRLVDKYFDNVLKYQIELHRLASGQIGGKSIGLLLAWAVLQRALRPELRDSIHMPVSYFVGSDEFTEFLKNPEISQVVSRVNSDDRSWEPSIAALFNKASLSKNTSIKLRSMLEKIQGVPIIVRSSSVLEDQTGSSFAGVYRSVFCSNQGDITSRLQEIESAIKEVYASAFSQNALVYRMERGYSQTPEEMAILIQAVEGQVYDGFYFPPISGIAFSQNPYCWTERLDPREGFLRLVCGLGSRAVRSMEGDYPRLIGLSNPRLRPESDAKDISFYSQHRMDVINLENGEFESVPIERLLRTAYPPLHYIASTLREDSIRKLASKPSPQDRVVVTFDALIEQTVFIDLIREVLGTLSEELGHVVNIEFSMDLDSEGIPMVALLQCRQFNWQTITSKTAEAINPMSTIIRTNTFLFAGEKRGIDYLVFIDPDIYLESIALRQQKEMSRIISKINNRLGRGYLLVGPGRWGSILPDLGVPVEFSDIYNAKGLIEIHRSNENILSATYGTHFFMDLVESNIALLAVNPGKVENYLNVEFFHTAQNLLPELGLDIVIYPDIIKVVQMPQNRKFNILASPAEREAYVYLSN